MDQKDAIAQLLNSQSVPLPRPDPRGSTFVQHIPVGELGTPNPFSAGEIPAQLLLMQRGYQVRPDVNIFRPEDIQTDKNMPYYQKDA